MRTNDELVEARVFLDTMVPVREAAERAEAMLQRKLATAFFIAEYAVGGAELPLNRIIADLLNPRGIHGQGGTFLKLFLNHVAQDLSIGDPESWVVISSQSTQYGRYVDIALRNAQIAIYIECKPWAAEGHQQLEDYANDLLTLPHIHKRLLFVPGLAREPDSITSGTRQRLGTGGLVIIQFQDSRDAFSIMKWLEQCAVACEADKVRVFIKDLADYLQTQFLTKETITMSEDPFISMMIPMVQNNRSYMEIILKFERMAPQLKRTVATSFLRELAGKLETSKPGWLVENHFKNFDQKYEWLSFRRKTWPDGWSICMSMEQPDFRGFCIGFSCPSTPEHLRLSKAGSKSRLATEDNRAAIRNALELPLISIGHRVGVSEWWPAYCWLPSQFRNWEGETFLLLAGLSQMPDGRTALETFLNWFQILSDSLGTIVNEILEQHVHD